TKRASVVDVVHRAAEPPPGDDARAHPHPPRLRRRNPGPEAELLRLGDLAAMLEALGDALHDDAVGLTLVPPVDLESDLGVHRQLDELGAGGGAEPQASAMHCEVEGEDVDLAG